MNTTEQVQRFQNFKEGFFELLGRMGEGGEVFNTKVFEVLGALNRRMEGFEFLKLFTVVLLERVTQENMRASELLELSKFGLFPRQASNCFKILYKRNKEEVKVFSERLIGFLGPTPPTAVV